MHTHTHTNWQFYDNRLIDLRSICIITFVLYAKWEKVCQNKRDKIAYGNIILMFIWHKTNNGILLDCGKAHWNIPSQAIWLHFKYTHNIFLFLSIFIKNVFLFSLIQISLEFGCSIHCCRNFAHFRCDAASNNWLFW